MKLDKDIHQRLVNPQPNPTLETNVRNVLVALNGKAPYDKLLKMIESIRVWSVFSFNLSDSIIITYQCQESCYGCLRREN